MTGSYFFHDTSHMSVKDIKKSHCLSTKIPNTLVVFQPQTKFHVFQETWNVFLMTGQRLAMFERRLFHVSQFLMLSLLEVHLSDNFLRYCAASWKHLIIDENTPDSEWQWALVVVGGECGVAQFMFIFLNFSLSVKLIAAQYRTKENWKLSKMRD